MRREVRIIAVTVLLAGLWTGGRRAAEAAAALDTFRVTDVEVFGLESITRAEILRRMGVSTWTSVWGDTEDWARVIAEHPLVKSAEVRRRMPGTLLVRVLERRPVALAATPTLEPVDGEGVRLPLDPADRRMDLPIMMPRNRPAPGGRLLSTDDRRLAHEVGRLMEADTAFLQMVSEVRWQDKETILARWSEPRVDFLLRPGAPGRRLREGLAVLSDALGREPGQPPMVIDLRFADQVVVRRRTAPSSSSPR